MRFAFLALLGVAQSIKLNQKKVHTHHMPSLAQLLAKQEESPKEIFAKVDADGDGSISFDELIAFFEDEMGEEIDPAHYPAIQAEFDKVDADGDGGVDLEEALAFMAAEEAEE